LILKQAKVDDVVAMNFYYVSYSLYNAMKNSELAKKYNDLYTERINELKKENIIVKSMYE